MGDTPHWSPAWRSEEDEDHTWGEQGDATLCIRDVPSCAVLCWFGGRNYRSHEARGGRSRMVKSAASGHLLKLAGSLKVEIGLVAWLQLLGAKVGCLCSQTCSLGLSVSGWVVSTAEVPGSSVNGPSPWRGLCQSEPKQELTRAMWNRCIPFSYQWILYLW